MTETKLNPIYDGRKSFYGKAIVFTSDDGEKLLRSYGSRVAVIADGKAELYPAWNFSATTIRHVKEFLRQNGFKAESTSEIAKDYIVIL